MSGANAPAANVAPQDRGTGEQRSHEPSMEEILASIRRIISDDQMLPLSPRASVPPLPSHSNSEAAATAPPAQRQEQGPDAADRAPDNQDATHEHHEDEAPHEHHDRHAYDDVLDLADVANSEHDHEANHGSAHDVEPTESVSASASGEPAVTMIEPASRPASVSAGTSPMTAAAIPNAAAQSHATAQSHAEPEHEPILSDNTVSSVSSSFHQLAATMLMQNFPPVDQIARELLRPMIKTWLDDNLPVMVERLVRAEIERVARAGR